MDGLAEESLLSLAEESRFALEPTLGTLNPKHTHLLGLYPKSEARNPTKSKTDSPLLSMVANSGCIGFAWDASRFSSKTTHIEARVISSTLSQGSCPLLIRPMDITLFYSARRLF